MDGIVLRPTQRVSYRFEQSRTQMVFVIVLLVLCSQVALSLRAMTIAAQADRQIAPSSIATPLSTFQAEATYDVVVECCTAGAPSHCLQSCSAVQQPTATRLQTPAAVPLWWWPADLWVRPTPVDNPSPPPKA